MDSAIESFAKGVKFSLRHCAFQSENQAIVEKSGMIQAIIISEQGIGNGTHIEKAIPIRITPCQAGDLQPKKNSHSSHSNFHIQVIKSGTFDERLARNTEVFIDGAHFDSCSSRAQSLSRRVRTAARSTQDGSPFGKDEIDECRRRQLVAGDWILFCGYRS